VWLGPAGIPAAGFYDSLPAQSKGAETLLRSPLVHFLLLGGLLFVIDAAWSRAPERVVIEVSRGDIAERIEAYRQQMRRDPTPSEIEAIERQVIEEAIWLEQAFALGLPEVDPVVRQRLLLNMRFLDDASEMSDDALLARAVELGMDRSDTVVQRRLIDRVQAIVRAGVRARPPTAADLEAYFAAQAERWREPALLDLSHVYLSRDRRSEKTRSDADELMQRLTHESTAPDEGVALGDPFLAGHRMRGASPTRIAARLGPDFADSVEAAPVLEWVGPVESAFGLHVVWIHAREESRIPELSEIRTRVLEDWIEAESRKALREHVERRREVVEVRMLAAPESRAPN
jgi:hypothetical protein